MPHERFVVLAALALSRTQDDKGRVRWTLFGGSEQGPERAFWRSFFVAPDQEAPDEAGFAFIRRLLAAVYGVEARDADHLYQVGFRVLPSDQRDALHWPPDEALPTWTARYQLRPRQSVRGVKYLLTFRPFGRLPETIQRAYLDGQLHLLPYPGSLVFWGPPAVDRLQAALPLALQIPLLNTIVRHEAPLRPARAAVGLDARAEAGSEGAKSRIWPCAQHLPPHPPLGQGAARPGRTGPDGT